MDNLTTRIKIIPRRLIKDERGWFLKVIDGKEEQLPNYTGEVYFTCALPNQTKGCHYHKIANEWFSPITGKAVLKLQDIYSDEQLDIELDADAPVTVFVPPFIAHAICNFSENDFILCAYTDQLYKPEDTISYLIQ
jgi:dTDP-4-dehydrorhamnose 3,5-epimerase-like enzyme